MVAAPGPVCVAGDAMGTRFELVLAGREPAALRAAGEEALEEVRRVDRDLSRFRTDGLLAWVHAQARTAPCRVPADFLALLRLCRAVHAASGGAFDPTVAPLMARHGFPTGVRTPAPEAPCGFGDVVLDAAAGTVFLPAGLELDFGGVGKGWALDRAAEVLADAGVTTALLHGGTSTVRAVGAPPDREAWQVALRDPDPDAREAILAVAALADTSLSVSAPHGRIRPSAEGGAGHIMDPRTGAPARGVRLAAVVTRDAASADAWSTALVVGGEARLAPGEALVVTAGGRRHHHAPAAIQITPDEEPRGEP